ncbi:MAG: DUF6273 domain-containing protein [Oscillospiraceae bacterium]|jgi:hypothetical protein|nr:DUF6273 domain-containing protein [Oscillospiraceae bacterium]
MKSRTNRAGYVSRPRRAARRRLAAALAALTLAALAVTGTYALVQFIAARDAAARGAPTVFRAALLTRDDMEWDAFFDDWKARFDRDPESAVNWQTVYNNWQPGDAPLPHPVRVKNTGTLGEDGEYGEYGDVYVRLQLKEFMEVFPVRQVLSRERYMTGEDGGFLVFDGEAEARAYLAANNLASRPAEQVRADIPYLEGGDYTDSAASLEKFAALCADMGFTDYAGGFDMYPVITADIEELDMLLDIASGSRGGRADADLPWYIPTMEGDPDGVYGAFVTLGTAVDTNPLPLVQGIGRAEPSGPAHGEYDSNLPNPDKTGECDYTLHTWESGLASFSNAPWANSGVTFDTFVRLRYGGVMLYTEWTQMSDPPSDVWVVDDRPELYREADCPRGHAEGEPCDSGREGAWVYWAQPLAPGGQTADFLESISLIRRPDGKFYYATHVDMQAVSLEELTYDAVYDENGEDVSDDDSTWRDEMPEQLYEALRRVDITAVAAVPMHGNAFIEDNAVLDNIISSDVETSFTFKTFIEGSPARRVDTYAVVTAVDPARPDEPLTVSSLSDRVTVSIPSGYNGSVAVTVGAAQDKNGAHSLGFTLNVKDLRSFMEDEQNPLTPHDTFVADSRMWRILSTDMGRTGPGTGEDVLIVSEYIVTMERWHTSRVVSGYSDSSMRLETLPEIYRSLTWAHDYAVLPDTGASYNTRDALTYDSGGGKPGEDGLDGLFLLSYGDYGLNTFFASSAARLARQIHSTEIPENAQIAAVNPGAQPGVPREQWTRSLRDGGSAAAAYYVAGNGTLGVSAAAPSTSYYGVRPAMLLSVTYDQITPDYLDRPIVHNEVITNIVSSNVETAFTFNYKTAPPYVDVPHVKAIYAPGCGMGGHGAESCEHEGEPTDSHGRVVIPPDYSGTVNVQVHSANDYTGYSENFTLTVTPLQQFINAIPLNSHAATFIADSREWRVLNKTTDTNPRGGATDVLLLSERVLGESDYGGAAEVLSALYDSLEWAHEYAMAPDAADSAPTYTTADPAGACFLLSNADFLSAALGFGASSSANAARQATNVRHIDSGFTFTHYWTRTHNGAALYAVAAATGAIVNNMNAATANVGVRPALLLHIATALPDHSDDIIAGGYGNTVSSNVPTAFKFRFIPRLPSSAVTVFAEYLPSDAAFEAYDYDDPPDELVSRILIPANFTGLVRVTVRDYANDGAAAMVFSLTVTPVQMFIGAIARDDSVTTFIADSWEWRVLSNSVGASGRSADGSDGENALIISEHIMALGQPYDTASRAGYVGSDLYNYLPRLYMELEWAHNYAILPNADSYWTGNGMNYNAAANVTKSTAEPQPVSSVVKNGDEYESGGSNGLFPPSYAEMWGQSPHDFWGAANRNDGASAARVSAPIHTTVGNIAGYTAAHYWIRNRNNNTTAYYAGSDGSMNHSAPAGAVSVTVSSVVTPIGVRPAMLLSFPAVQPTHRNGNIKQGEVFGNVVSADEPTVFSFGVSRFKNNATPLIVQPEYSPAPGGGADTTPYSEANFGYVVIPAGYTGVITVTVKDGVTVLGGVIVNDPLAIPVTTFYINVTPIRRYIDEHPEGNVFVADSWAWRVVGKQMSAAGAAGAPYNNGAGSGGHVLILSEYIYALSRFHGGAVTGGYLGSEMYGVTLPGIYESLAWAHGYAVLPSAASGYWTSANTAVGTGANQQGNADNATKDTGLPVDASGENGLFLLSYYDYANLVTSRAASTIHSTSDGNGGVVGSYGAAAYWMRSMYDSSNAYTVSASGTIAQGTRSAVTAAAGIRPAMLLMFTDILPAHGNNYVTYGGTMGNIVSLAYDSTLRLEFMTNGAAAHTVTYYTDEPVFPVQYTTDEPSCALPIDAGYSGVMGVTISAAGAPAGAATFYLTITPIGHYIDAMPSGSHHKDNTETFVADNTEWRVLTKTMGASGGATSGGSDVLVVSEYIMPSSSESKFTKWHGTDTGSTAVFAGGYLASDMRNVTLPAIFEGLRWAHDYAVLPDMTPAQGWGGALSWGDTYGLANNITKSSAAAYTPPFTYDGITGEITGGDGTDRLFLLSYRDSYSHAALWGGTGDNDGTTDTSLTNAIRAVYLLCALEERQGGTQASFYWTRNNATDNNYRNRAYRFPRAALLATNPGSVGDSMDGTTALFTSENIGIRPAMILRFTQE